MNTLQHSIGIIRKELLSWRTEQVFLKKLSLSLGFALLTGLLAQLRLPLLWTPVPITGQTLAVMLCGFFLGSRWGTFSQAFYLTAGVLGLPWFSGFTGGWAALWGPTGGYLLGFMFTAFFIGSFARSLTRSRNIISLILVLSLGELIILIAGTLQLSLWLTLISHQSVALTGILAAGILPFLPGEIIKIVLATTIIKLVTGNK